MYAPLVTRGIPGLAAAIPAGGLSVAFLLVSMSHMNTPLMFLSYFTALPLYLAGLGAGVLAGVAAAITGALALYATQPAGAAAMYTVIIGLPAIIVSALALRYRFGDDRQPHWYPSGYLLTAITFYPCALFLLADAAASGHAGGLQALTAEAFASSAANFAATYPPDQIEVFRRMMDGMAKIAPAMAGYAWILMTMLTLGGAQHILKKQNLNLRDGLTLISLRMPVWLIYAVVGTGLFGVYGHEPYDYIGRNLSLILGLPFFFTGIGIIHALVASVRYSWVALVVFYLLLIIAPWMAFIIATVGIIDQWVNFRHRFASKTTA